MRVLQVTVDYPPTAKSGIGTHVGALVSAMQHFHEIEVFAPADGHVTSVEPQVTRLNSYPVFNKVSMHDSAAGTTLRALAHSVEIVGKGLGTHLGKFDLIHFHGVETCLAAYELQQQLAIPSVYTKHHIYSEAMPSSAQDPAQKELLQLALNLEDFAVAIATRIIAVSTYTAQRIHERWGADALSKTDVIINGYSKQCQLPSELAVTKFRSQFPTDSTPVMLVPARLSPRKGHAQLLDNLAAISQHLPLFSIGFAGAGPEKDQLREKARSLGLESRLKFLGHLNEEDLSAAYVGADVIIIPSTYDYSPMTIAESVALGKLPVVANTSGLSEMVGDDGVLFDPSDAKSLLKALQDVIGLDRRIYRRRLDSLTTRLSSRRMARDTLSVYNSALATAVE